MSLINSFRPQICDDAIQRGFQSRKIGCAVHRFFFSSKVKSSQTSTFKILANFSNPATDGTFTPRSTRLMNSTEQPTPCQTELLESARLACGLMAAYPFNMSTISVSDLQKKPAKQWLKSAGKDDLVITSKGRPVAVLLRIAAASIESTRALVRSVRALQAQSTLQQAAAASGAAELSMSDIDAEIAASRRARRRK